MVSLAQDAAYQAALAAAENSTQFIGHSNGGLSTSRPLTTTEQLPASQPNQTVLPSIHSTRKGKAVQERKVIQSIEESIVCANDSEKHVVYESTRVSTIVTRNLVSTAEASTSGRNGVEPPASSARIGSKPIKQFIKVQAKSESWVFKGFELHLTVEGALAGISSGKLLRGCVRINTTSPGAREAFVSIPSLPCDVCIRNDIHRNRAIEGDEVALELLALPQWFKVRKTAACGKVLASMQQGNPWWSARDEQELLSKLTAFLLANTDLRPTAKVVAILEPSRRRQRVVGTLSQGPPPESVLDAVIPGSADVAPVAEETCVYLTPLSEAMPRCVLTRGAVLDLPPALAEEAAGTVPDAPRTLVSACIHDWPAHLGVPEVVNIKSLGQAGEIEGETIAILVGEGIRDEPFGPDVLACLPPTPWSIPAEEYSKRRDFRSHTVFTIDPPTAKDMDDALHVEEIDGEEGRLRVGVHIADVSYFVAPDSALDTEAAMRTTSTYMVNRVVPMLPPLLCEELCSLNPGVERLTFSVVFDLDEDGHVLSHWIGRSVIRSVAKLSYPLVQTMIDDTFDPSNSALPVLHSPSVSWEAIRSTCLRLHHVAQRIRAERFAGGAVRLDNVRLFFKLDANGNPVSTSQYIQKTAQQLIEEFMLLANKCVASTIASVYPECALLRSHPPPDPLKLNRLAETVAKLGLTLDCSSSGALHESLCAMHEAQAAGELLEDDTDAKHILDTLVMMATRSMYLAAYFSTGEVPLRMGWRHYALAVDDYTHFTSPIRRYPDILVHRLLSAALQACGPNLPPYGSTPREKVVPVQDYPKLVSVVDDVAALEAAAAAHGLLDGKQLGIIAKHCNETRYSARLAQDRSLTLYFCLFVRTAPIVTRAVVSMLGGDSFFKAYLPEFGCEVRIVVNALGISVKSQWDEDEKCLILREDRSPAPLPEACEHPATENSREGFHLATWMAGVSTAIINSSGLDPVELPLELKTFSVIPVVLFATLKSVNGCRTEVVAKLFVPDAIPAAGITASAEHPAVATSLGEAEEEFCIPYENIILD